MTIRDADGNKLEGTVPKGVSIKPGDTVTLEARVDRNNQFKRPTRFKRT